MPPKGSKNSNTRKAIENICGGSRPRGELIAPIPPLPLSSTEPLASGSPAPANRAPETSNGSTASKVIAPSPEADQPKVKKTRSRKKVEATSSEQEPASMIEASDPTTEVAPKPA